MKDNSIVKQINFQDEELGKYTSDKVKRVWNNPPHCRGCDEGRVEIVKDGSKKVLRISHAKNKVGPREGGAQWRLNLDKSYDELYVQFKIKFARDFDFKRGGKLPGLQGGSVATGGKDSPKGFSARIMWREGGFVNQYIYYPTKSGDWGRDIYWFDLGSNNLEKIKFKLGKWHTIKTRIKINEFKFKGNGYITSWLDGKLVLHQDINLKIKGEEYGIDNFNFVTFFGGNDESWSPEKNEEIYFDDFIISTKDIN